MRLQGWICGLSTKHIWFSWNSLPHVSILTLLSDRCSIFHSCGHKKNWTCREGHYWHPAAKGVGSPPWLIVLSLYWPCLGAADNSPTRLTFSPSRVTDLTCPLCRQQLDRPSPNYTTRARCASALSPSTVNLEPNLKVLETKKYQKSKTSSWILPCCYCMSRESFAVFNLS